MRLFFIIFISFITLQANTLLGNWVVHTAQGDIYLRFISNSQLIYDGEQTNYIISGNVIRIANEYGYTDYPFTKKKNNLRINFPEGYQLNFKKDKKIKIKTQHRDNTSYLRGKFCHYSSSYNGGYSTTSWVIFDGVRYFTTGSGSSYSGENGLYQGSNDSQGGSYKVIGKKIQLQAIDGSKYKGSVTDWKNNGDVVSININGKVYASVLCD